jgi:phage-related protein
VSSSIDNKVVSIEFNNASFESKIAATLKSIENLQKSLQFEGAKAGFADLSKAADGVTLNGISEGIEGVSNKFIALTTIGVTALATLTTKAIDAGLQIAKSLAISPIAQGFQEYELKMGAIQTIMAGSGASLGEVNQKLQELNTYSDQTIYSFADMTQNIGKFTNAGVSLDDSVASIKGIANVAALSGANSEEAARSMYNFAQSLSSGSVKLMDWKSIELANMATVEFKTELLESAVAAGTLTKEIDGTYKTLEGTPVTATKGFNESLQEQWLTSQALTDTLGRYSDATTDIGARATAAATEVKTFTQLMSTVKESVGSGWASSFEILFGNFEEAKALWTGVNASIGDFVGKSADARNELLQGWKDLGGRTLLIDSLGTAFYALGKVLAPIKEAFRDIFPKQTAEGLMGLTQSFAVFTQKLIPTEETVDKIRRIFSGFFSAIKIGIEVVKGIFSVFYNLFDLFAGSAASGGIMEFFALIGDGITALKEVLVDGRKIETFFGNINSVVAGFVNVLIGAFDKIQLALAYFKVGFTDQTFGDRTAERIGGVIEVIYNLGAAFKKVKDAVVDFLSSLDFSILTDAFASVKEAVQGLFNRDLGVPEATSDSFSAFTQILSGLGDIFQQIIDKVGSFISGMGGAADAVGDGVSEVSNAVSDIFTAIGDAFESPDFNFDNVMKVVAAGLFGGVIALIAKFLKDGIKINFGQFALMDQLKGVLEGVTGNLKAMQTNIKADTLMKIAVALGVLTASILVLSLIDGESLAKALGALTVGIGQLSGAMYLLTKMTDDAKSAAKFVLLAIGLTILAGAVLLLGLAARLLSGMGWEEIARGLVAVTGLLLAMAEAVYRMGDPNKLVGVGLGILIISGAMLVLGLAMKLMATLGWEEMVRGLFGVGAGMLILSQAMSKMPTSGMVQAGLSILIVAGSLFVLGLAIKSFAAMDLKTVAEGLVYIGITLALIIGAMNAIDSRQVLQVSTALLIASAALLLMGKAVEQMGSMSIQDIIKGVVGLGLVMHLLSTTMQALKKTSAGNAIVLFLLAQALGSLAGVLSAVGSLPFPVLISGLAGIAGVLGILIAAGHLAKPALEGLYGLGGAILMIGVGIGVFAAGLGVLGMGFKAFSEGLGLLAVNGEAGLKAFVAMLDDFLLILPTVAVALGLAAVSFAGSFLSGFATLIPEVVNLLIMLLDAIIEVAPKLWEAAQTIITEFLNNFQVLYPKIVETGIGMLLALLRGIEENIGEITSLAIGIVTEFINGMAEGIPDYVRAMVNLFTTVFTTLGFELGMLMTTLGPQIGIAFIDGVLTGISMTVQKIKDFFGEWAGQILDFIKGLFGINSPSTEFISIGVDLILGLLKGIVDTIVKVTNFFLDLAGDILGWVGDLLGTLVGKGTDIITGMWTGITNGIIAVTEFFTGLAATILGWIGDVLGSLVQKGTDLIAGLWTGIWNRIQDVWTFYTELASTIVEKIGDVATSLKDKGIALIQGLWDGIWERIQDVFTFYKDLGTTIVSKITNALTALKNTGIDFIAGLWEGIKEKWETVKVWVTNIPTMIVNAIGDVASTLLDVGKNIVLGLWEGIKDKFENFLRDKLGWLFDKLPGWVKDLLGIDSPSKVFAEIGQWIPAGIAVGIEDNMSVIKDTMGILSDNIVSGFAIDEKDLTTPIVNAMHTLTEALSISEDFNPTITPVLDLSQVTQDAKLLKSLYPDLSSSVASNISAAELEASSGSINEVGGESGVNVQFVQNNNSPKALSTNDIYRNTRNQLAIAKEELNIR